MHIPDKNNQIFFDNKRYYGKAEANLKLELLSQDLN